MKNDALSQRCWCMKTLKFQRSDKEGSKLIKKSRCKTQAPISRLSFPHCNRSFVWQPYAAHTSHASGVNLSTPDPRKRCVYLASSGRSNQLRTLMWSPAGTTLCTRPRPFFSCNRIPRDVKTILHILSNRCQCSVVIRTYSPSVQFLLRMGS